MEIKAEDQYELIEFIISKINVKDYTYNDWRGYKFDIYEGIFYYEIYFFDSVGKTKFDFVNINCPLIYFESRLNGYNGMVNKIKTSYTNCVLHKLSKNDISNFPCSISFNNSIIV